MNLKNTLFMGLVLLTVVAFIYVVELPEERRAESRRSALAKESIDAAARIEISSAGGSFALVNADPKQPPAEPSKEAAIGAQAARAASWSIAEIKDAPVEKFAFSSLATALESLAVENPIPAGERAADPAVYGLKDPEVRIAVISPASRSDILLGKKNEYVGKRYAELKRGDGSSEVFLTDEALYNAAKKSRDELRNRNPIDFTDSSVKAVSIEWNKETIGLEPGEKGSWKLTRPLQAPASPVAVSGFLRELRAFKTTEFIDAPGDLKQYNLDKPRARVRIEFTDESRPALDITVSPGQKSKEIEPAYFAIAGRNPVYKIALNPLNSMMKSAELFRERKLFAFTADQATRVEWKQGDATLVAAKESTGWTVDGKPGDAVFIRQYLSDLAAVEAAGFAREARDFGLAAPRLALAVTLTAPGSEAPEVRTLTVGAEAKLESKEKGYYVQVSGLNEPFIIGEGMLKKISPSMESLQRAAATPAPLDTKSPAGG